jgi:STE24 endopeptidase
VLSTTKLPDSPLRRRLERICAQNKLRYREILLWHTDNHMSNAAVMGVLPRWRYILLSDLLLETMSDEQIEAVFAHEVGHIVHRHMSWYAVFFVALMLAIAGPGEYLARQIGSLDLPRWLPDELITTLFAAACFVLGFGFVSRRFERQADVFAARMVELTRPNPVALGLETIETPRRPMDWHVGEYGATVFSSALRRVAIINNIPLVRTQPSGVTLRARLSHWMDCSIDLVHNWMHGSIPARMQYVQSLSADPARTARFDRVMFRVYALLLLTTIVGALVVAMS